MRAEAAETVRPAMPRGVERGQAGDAGIVGANAGVAEHAGENRRPAAPWRGLPPTSAPCEPVTMIWPASSGAISEAELISTMPPAPAGVGEHPPRLFDGLGIAAGRARAD